MSGARSDLKDKVGWGAYVVAGAQSLRSPNISARVALDNGKHYAVTGRSLLFANCSTLVMGVVLAPNAKLDDGKLDVAILEAEHGQSDGQPVYKDWCAGARFEGRTTRHQLKH